VACPLPANESNFPDDIDTRMMIDIDDNLQMEISDNAECHQCVHVYLSITLKNKFVFIVRTLGFLWYKETATINLKGDNPLMFHNDRLIYRYIKFVLDSCNRIDENIDGVGKVSKQEIVV
jgi:hypothetical protein